MSTHLIFHRNWRGRSPWPAAIAGAMMLATMSMGTMAAHAASTVTFNYNGTNGSDGTAQTWTVPTGVFFATFDVFGAAGGIGGLPDGYTNGGGLGGEATAGIALTPGDVLTITVAGKGADATGGSGSISPGGFGGGATGNRTSAGAGGGGASDVRTGAASLSDRVLVGGGGGGAGAYPYLASGGAGGGLTGGDGSGVPPDNPGGSGGNQTGTTGSGTPGTGSPGSPFGGGGGGGGYWGGQGGFSAGGGGGSGFGPAGVIFQSGVRSGNGLVTITYTPNVRPPDCSGVTASPSTLHAQLRTPGFTKVALSGATDPDGDTLTFTINGVTQDEAVAPTTPDAMTAAKSNQVQLRKELDPAGNGRVYRIAYTVSDGLLSCSGTETVAVPVKGDGAVDDAPPSWNSFTGAPI